MRRVLGVISPIGHVEAKTFDKVMAVNVTGTWRLIRSVDPLLRFSDAGRAVVVTSSLAHSAKAFWAPYAASKAAVEALARSWAEETENLPLRVNAFDPGRARTAMRAQAMPGENPETVPHPPTRRRTSCRWSAPISRKRARSTRPRPAAS